MKNKQITYGQQSREGLMAGVDAVANAVKATLGPQGRNVVIYDSNFLPHVTKDGVTVARSIKLKDHLQSTGALMVIQAAQKTVEEAGDGTSTCTVLAQSMIRSAFSDMKNEPTLNIVEYRKGMEAALREVVDQIKHNAAPVVDDKVLRNIAKVSANNNEEIADTIFKAVEKVGATGTIGVNETHLYDTTVEVVNGYKSNKGYFHDFFKNTSRKARYENALVAILDHNLMFTEEVIPLLHAFGGKLKKGECDSLLIFARNCEGEALSTIIKNKDKFPMVVCQTPWGEDRNEALKDISACTGAAILSDENGRSPKEIVASDLGRVRKFEADNEETVLFEPGRIGNEPLSPELKSAVSARVGEIKKTLRKLKTGEKDVLAENRLGMMERGFAMINVGARSESELREKVDLIDDAIHAVRSAKEEGIVLGGGFFFACAILKDIHQISDPSRRSGFLCVWDALQVPHLQILANSGINSDEGAGFDSPVYHQMLEDQEIYDPAKVVRCAIEHAVGVASTIISTEVAITEEQ